MLQRVETAQIAHSFYFPRGFFDGGGGAWAPGRLTAREMTHGAGIRQLVDPSYDDVSDLYENAMARSLYQ